MVDKKSDNNSCCLYFWEKKSNKVTLQESDFEKNKSKFTKIDSGKLESNEKNPNIKRTSSDSSWNWSNINVLLDDKMII